MWETRVERNSSKTINNVFFSEDLTKLLQLEPISAVSNKENYVCSPFKWKRTLLKLFFTIFGPILLFTLESISLPHLKKHSKRNSTIINNLRLYQHSKEGLTFNSPFFFCIRTLTPYRLIQIHIISSLPVCDGVWLFLSSSLLFGKKRKKGNPLGKAESWYIFNLK